MSIKVLIATPLYPPDIGGPATYTTLLERELPQHGYEVTVVSFGASRHLPKVFRHIHFFVRVFRAARGQDIVLAQDPVSVGLPSMYAAKLRRKKFVIRMPGDYAWEQSTQRFGVIDTIDVFQKKRYGFRVELLRSLQQFVTRRADAIMTPSNYFSDLVRGWGVRPEAVTTVYNGIDTTSTPKEISKPSGTIMVTAGRLVPWKGMDFLISLLPTLSDWKLYIIGDGPQRMALEAQAVRLGVTDRVVFLGSLPRAEVLGWCAAADAFVLNTHFESFSFQIAEAMHSGARIITNRIGSLPELVIDGEEGVLLTPNDTDAYVAALRSIETDTAAWEQRSIQAQKKAKQFSIAHTVSGVHAVCTKLVQ